VSEENLGYDIESFDPRTGRLGFIEMKGRRAGAETVTVTRNEIMTGINSLEKFFLAIVEVEDGQAKPPRYIQNPFSKEPDFGGTSVNYDLGELLTRPNRWR
jgi:hypothetical protein